MHYVALATDYDGTIAHHGAVDAPTLEALERLRAGARKLILVTGRELPDLLRVMPDLSVFDLVVAENGALLYHPETREERPLAEPPPERFAERLRELGVEPLSVGRVIVATWEPNETAVLQAIRELGLELQITFNKGAVMVLPGGVTKASGLRAALEALELSPLNCVAVGDAENDMAMLDSVGLPVAVANALPSLRERVALVTRGERGEGVAELVDRLLDTDLAEIDLAPEGIPEGPAARERVALAKPEEGRVPLPLVPQRESLLLTGHSGGGKSTLTFGLLERLHEAGFQTCILDPEGDYEGTRGTVMEGAPDAPPDPARVVELLRRTQNGVVVNMLGVKLADRPAYLAALLPELMGLRARTGRPHVVVVDEAHHMLPADFDPGAAALPGRLEGFLFITMRPQLLTQRVLEGIGRMLVVGAEPGASLAAFCEARGLPAPGAVPGIETGQALLLDTAVLAEGGDPAAAVRRVEVIPGTGTRRRHQRKYAEGKLRDDLSFYFRGPEGRLNLRAHNLTLFVQMAEGVDEETWTHHRRQGDYSRWMEACVKDEELAGEVAQIEDSEAPFEEARAAIREAIERRYTAPG
ncbi:HAD-IIB family hydrolase [Roseomonas sp. OT10]|uniref:HAD-IIB family hydrolase n=1 Tax=Roseomonas cutis TaxID=2897332 RepID=UPI001E643B8B|nr:HAD-IIB family hydrolase [Roseomonas sp. OT10]UFN49707.1 HAD-IIB family hydrolase [Roseomonas sp. OT10]